jgi:hypothetical protein
MRGRQDDIAIIVVVVRSSPTLSVRSAYASRCPVDLSSPTLSMLVEAEYRTACCTTMGTRPSSLFLTMFPPSPLPSSSPTTLDPRHHRPCRPHPLLHRRCRRSSATLVTIAIAPTTLFVTALIIGHALSLLFVTRRRVRVHRLPSKIPSSKIPPLVDCWFFTPAVASAVITVDVAVASATTIAATTLPLQPLSPPPPSLPPLLSSPWPSSPLPPTTAAPAAGAVTASAAAAAANANVNAAPLPPRRQHHSRWRQMPSSHRHPSPPSSTPSNAAAADVTGAIEPRLHRPPPPPRTAQHYSLPCWQYLLTEVALDLNTKER